MSLVTAGMWKSQPFPEERDELNFSASYSHLDMEAIKLGFLPKEMEDKWFIYFQNNILYCHRSWTGFCIFVLKFTFTTTGAYVEESWVNRNPEQYRSTSIEADKNNIGLIIDFFLRHKKPDTE